MSLGIYVGSKKPDHMGRVYLSFMPIPLLAGLTMESLLSATGAELLKL